MNGRIFRGLTFKVKIKVIDAWGGGRGDYKRVGVLSEVYGISLGTLIKR